MGLSVVRELALVEVTIHRLRVEWLIRLSSEVITKSSALEVVGCYASWLAVLMTDLSCIWSPPTLLAMGREHIQPQTQLRLEIELEPRWITMELTQGKGTTCWWTLLWPWLPTLPLVTWLQKQWRWETLTELAVARIQPRTPDRSCFFATKAMEP